jgi:hypothetical protein
MEAKLEAIHTDVKLLRNEEGMRSAALVDALRDLKGSLKRLEWLLTFGVLTQMGKLVEVVLQLTRPHGG